MGSLLCLVCVSVGLGKNGALAARRAPKNVEQKGYYKPKTSHGKRHVLFARLPVFPLPALTLPRFQHARHVWSTRKQPWVNCKWTSPTSMAYRFPSSPPPTSLSCLTRPCLPRHFFPHFAPGLPADVDLHLINASQPPPSFHLGTRACILFLFFSFLNKKLTDPPSRLHLIPIGRSSARR